MFWSSYETKVSLSSQNNRRCLCFFWRCSQKNGTFGRGRHASHTYGLKSAPFFFFFCKRAETIYVLWLSAIQITLIFNSICNSSRKRPVPICHVTFWTLESAEALQSKTFFSQWRPVRGWNCHRLIWKQWVDMWRKRGRCQSKEHKRSTQRWRQIRQMRMVKRRSGLQISKR